MTWGRVTLIAGVGVAGALLIAFPGRRSALAFTIATGVGTPSLQARIDALEDKAIRGASFSVADTRFLADFYATLATGATLTIVVRQTGRLMRHYLRATGTDLGLDPEIFTDNPTVSAQMALLRQRAASLPCSPSMRLVSPTFYMPDARKLDSVYGLYYGRVQVTGAPMAGGACALRWRGEVPWSWPSYASLKAKYGTFHAERFPLPNLRSMVSGRRHALFVDNGLGEYLVHLRLAKPFLAFAEWDERTPSAR